MMSSQQSWRRASSVSPGNGGNISTNIGVMTCGQPSRMRESVPSKSKRTWLISGRVAKFGANSTSPPNEGGVDFDSVWTSVDLVWSGIKLGAKSEQPGRQVQARTSGIISSRGPDGLLIDWS